jgi:hypothetical protein
MNTIGPSPGFSPELEDASLVTHRVARGAAAISPLDNGSILGYTLK